MRVFHGSYAAINRIDLSKCEIGKDFGQGFYVTKIKEQAQFWAERKGLRHNNTEGIVTEFEFNENAFQYFNLKTLRFDGYNECWLDFVTMNRNTALPQPTHDYDIVEGPVADDKIATRIKDYLKGEISKQQFLEELKFVRETHQICFCTLKSLQMIELADNTLNAKIEAISETIIQALITNEGISTEEACDRYYYSETYKNLEDTTTDLYLKPWQEVYGLLITELHPTTPTTLNS